MIVTMLPGGGTQYATHEWVARKQQIHLLSQQVEKVLGVPCVWIDDTVQDANHCATISIADLEIRFSCYGNLFTVNLLEEIPDTFSARIVPVVEASGYVYVSEDELYQPYSGSNERYIGKTWWDRFFDYM
jgi:hypothetical protein